MIKPKPTMERAMEIIADRIEEAADTLRRMPDRERALLAKSERGQTWPLMLHQACEHAAYEGLKVRRPPPTAKHIDRMNEVLDWLLELAKIDSGYFKVVWLLFAKRRTPTEVARIVGVTRETVYVRRRAALTLLVVQIVPSCGV
jgi:hypothetical protein